MDKDSIKQLLSNMNYTDLYAIYYEIRLILAKKRHEEKGLTNTQLCICEMVYSAWSTKEMAEELNIATHSIQFHLKELFTIYNVKNRTQLLVELIKDKPWNK